MDQPSAADSSKQPPPLPPREQEKQVNYVSQYTNMPYFNLYNNVGTYSNYVYTPLYDQQLYLIDMHAYVQHNTRNCFLLL